MLTHMNSREIVVNNPKGCDRLLTAPIELTKEMASSKLHLA